MVFHGTTDRMTLGSSSRRIIVFRTSEVQRTKPNPMPSTSQGAVPSPCRFENVSHESRGLCPRPATQSPAPCFRISIFVRSVTWDMSASVRKIPDKHQRQAIDRRAIASATERHALSSTIYTVMRSDIFYIEGY